MGVQHPGIRDASMSVPIWVVGCDPSTQYRIGGRALKKGDIKVLNGLEWEMAVTATTGSRRSLGPGTSSLPACFLRLALELPDGVWDAPDYFEFGIFSFISAKFRDAVGVLPTELQYLPLDLRTGRERARKQDYNLLRVTAHQPAMDCERSVYELGSVTAPGRPTTSFVRSIDSYVLRDDIVPASEIFWDDIVPTSLLAVDALAERVMKAGCTGIRFRDPATYKLLSGLLRYRTATGVAEEKLG